MIIPIEWLKDYLNIDKDKKSLGNDFTAIGLMVDKPTNKDILDLEHRMDRSDWLSIIGCARDIAAFNNTKVKLPEMYEDTLPKVSEQEKINVEVEAKQKVNRFKTVIFKNIKVEQSPEWLKKRLETYGIKSINNIVDITNYVMLEFGQPLHAQDIDKLEKKEIILKDADTSKSVITLLGEDVKLVKENFVLESNNEPLVIGGIVGGKKTGVTFETKDIILDSGNYNQTYIRKASRKLKIQNETVLRSDKFLSPASIDLAINRAIYLILKLAGGEVYFNNDWYLNKVEPTKITLNLNRVTQLSGVEYNKQLVVDTLLNLDYKIIDQEQNTINLEIPYFRTDIQVEDDIVADILRINDYQNIKAKHIDKVPPTEITSDIYNFEDKIKEICVNLGLHEHITDPLIDKNIIEKQDLERAIILDNPLTSEKSALRLNIKDTLLNVYQNYSKNKFEIIELFEVGKVYYKKDNEYIEERRLQIIYHNTKDSLKKSSNEFKSLLTRLLQELGINWSEASKYWQIDAISMSIKTEDLLKLHKNSNRVYSEIDNNSSADFSIICELTFRFGDLYTKISNLENVIDIIVIEERLYNEDKKSILFRVIFKNTSDKNIHNKILNIIENTDSVKIRE